MPDALARFLDRVFAPIPGWMLLGSGTALIALAVLAPAWLESQELRWQVGLMREQDRRLADEEQNYTRFDEALAADDPVVLERLAFYHLRLKPAGADILSAAPRPPGRGGTGAVLTAEGAASSSGEAAPPAPPRAPSVEEWLYTPVPRPGVDYPLHATPATRLVRITSTLRGRLGLLAAGVLCVLAGLITQGPPPGASPGPHGRTA